MTRVRYGARAPQISKDISNRFATAPKSARSVSSVAVASAIEKSMRMKNRPLSRSPNCWLSMMLPPCSTRNPDTAYTMPGWSGQSRMRTKSPDGLLAFSEVVTSISRRAPCDDG